MFQTSRKHIARLDEGRALGVVAELREQHGPQLCHGCRGVGPVRAGEVLVLEAVEVVAAVAAVIVELAGEERAPVRAASVFRVAVPAFSGERNNEQRRNMKKHKT